MIPAVWVYVYVRDGKGGEKTYRVEDSTISGVSIDRGVDTLGDALQPATCSMRFLDPDGKLRDILGLMNAVRVITADAHNRFVGFISDVSVTYDLDDGWVVDVIAIEQTGVLGEPFDLSKGLPQARAGERIASVLKAVYPYASPRIDIEGTWTLKPLDPDPAGAEAWTILNAAAAADQGFLLADRTAKIRYYGHDQLAGTNLIRAVLHGKGVLADSRWTKTLDEFVTRVKVELPSAPGTYYSVDNIDRQVAVGRRVTLTLDAPYAIDSEAKDAAKTALARKSGDEWLTDALTVDLGLPIYNAGRTWDVMKLEPGDLVWVVEAPQATPAWGDAAGQVYLILGWSEVIDPGNGSWRFAFRVVDYATIKDRAMWGNVAMSWKSAGATAVQDYTYGPPALAPNVTP